MEQTQPQTSGASPAAVAAPSVPVAIGGGLAGLRDWGDALLVAFVLAMFVRVFLVELFKIPTGSMTPTLIGGEVAEVDYNGDGKSDLLLLNAGGPPLLFLDEGGRLTAQGPIHLSWVEEDRLQRQGSIHSQYDRILVNKFAYWFHPPERGDVVVFKVPDAIWQEDKPIFIKRCVGLPGETISFDGQGRLIANDKAVNQPPFFGRQRYETLIQSRPEPTARRQSEYDTDWRGELRIVRSHVPRGQIFVFGDNTHSSADSRYWGGVPLANVKGKAFFKYYPIKQRKFLNGQ